MDQFDPDEVYEAPTGLIGSPVGEGEDEDRPDLRFLAAWERRRVVYNGVLAAVVLLTTVPALWRPFLDPVFFEMAIAGAFGANVCFCTGPVVEAYLRWMGVRGRSLGRILFGLGLLVSVALTFFCVCGYLFYED